ncbi:hypothetical protein [Streptomyces ipomoeae]|uniref:hypothetical protein n=1 Tax=Streptomyces ipomoeae TaxID=103232 RepID=UPI0015F09F67
MTTPSALVSALAGRGLAYLHVGFAAPDSPVYQDIRRQWPGTLLANPVLPTDQIPADGGKSVHQ